ncbi:Transcription factor bhlh [Thalictrum thalictroides]|uniref:Transcription factor bhlh n=1 Tax=Thalictrum thalictroides TaxID=46969 RepID=A0A7J6WQY2_THATH|nr:Transcription factor bhlh [Thalictrum thalictroides]
MDCFYQDTEILWSSAEPFVVVPSAFVPYTKSTEPFKLANSSKGGQNMNKRMIEFLRTLPRCYDTSHEHLQVKERSYRHMIKERLRRFNQKQTYAALHSMLPPGTKNDKNSVLQISALHLQELKGLKEELQKQNLKLEKNLSHVNQRVIEETTTIHMRWQYPSSGIDSMIGVLTCLKNMGLKARTIQSEFSVAEFYAVLEIEPKVEAVVVEKAIQIALADLEWSYCTQVSQQQACSSWSL